MSSVVTADAPTGTSLREGAFGNATALSCRECGHRLELGPQNVPVVLENLSVGGMCLSGVPITWTVDQVLRGTLAAGAVRLPIVGRVAWSRGRTIGVSFDERPPTHEMLVFRVLRQLAEEGVEARQQR